MIKEALRTGKIEIDTQKVDDVQWIITTIQKLQIEDTTGKVISESFRDNKIYKRVQDVALETVPFIDPVTGLQGDISVAGMGTVIKAIMIKWILENNPNTAFDTALGMVIKNG